MELRDGFLDVSAKDPRWTSEVERATPTILARMQHLLGPGAIKGIRVTGGARELNR